MGKFDDDFWEYREFGRLGQGQETLSEKIDRLISLQEKQVLILQNLILKATKGGKFGKSA